MASETGHKIHIAFLYFIIHMSATRIPPTLHVQRTYTLQFSLQVAYISKRNYTYIIDLQIYIQSTNRLKLAYHVLVSESDILKHLQNGGRIQNGVEMSKQFLIGFLTVTSSRLQHFRSVIIKLVTVMFITETVSAIVALPVGNRLFLLRFALWHFVDSLCQR